MNQCLTRFAFFRAESRGILATLFLILFIVTACGGGGLTIQPRQFIEVPAANPCPTNPFDVQCINDRVARLEFCSDDTQTTDTKTADCEAMVIGVCADNPFDTLCIDDPIIQVAQVAFCRDTSKPHIDKEDNCAGVIRSVCLDNPFQQTTGTAVGNLCAGSYDRLAFCRDSNKTHEDKASDCAGVIKAACLDNAFDGLCVGDYATDAVARLAFCRDTSKTPVGKASDCDGTIRTACLDNAFDTLCIGDYTTDTVAKLAFCRDGAKTPKGKAGNCSGDLITTACVANPFDRLCTGAFEVNNADRLAFCRDAGRNPVGKEVNCSGSLIETACLANPFDTLCTKTRDEKLAFCRSSKTHADKTTNCAGSLIETACLDNAFDTLCTGDYATDADEQLAFCRDGSKNPVNKVRDCDGTIRTACLDNAFDALCIGDYATDADAKLTFCRDTSKNPVNKVSDCAGTIRTACLDNAFDELCIGDYATDAVAKLAFCRDTSKNPVNKVSDCDGTIRTACLDNAFDTLCTGDYATDADAKLTFCRDTGKNPVNKVRDCDGTIRTACLDNAFDTLCIGDYATDTVAKLAFCRDGSKNPVNKVRDCDGTIKAACLDNAFDALCIGDYATDADEQLAFCRDGSKNPVNKVRDCAGTIRTACLDNAFDTLCIGDYTTDAVAKLAFCRDGSKNPVNKVRDCDGTIRTACLDNAFDALCIGDYATDADAELAFCRDTNKLHADKDTNCAGTINTACGLDPFAQTTGTIGDLCIDTSGTAYADARMKHCADHTITNKNPACADKNDGTGIVQTYCNGRSAADDIYGICDSTNGKEFTAWRGNDDSSPVIGAGSASSGDDSANLIAGGANALYFGNGITAINTTTLYLAEGNTTDGIAIASADFGGELQSYAGLLSGSDLGGPIANGTTGTANWTGGKIAIGWHDGTGITTLFNTGFDLMVDFENGTLTASNVAVGASKLDIAGTFAVGATAVSGTTTLTTNSNGVTATIRGVIGTEGVLAVFATNDTVTSGFYAGGFVAASGGAVGIPAATCADNPFTVLNCTDGHKNTYCMIDGNVFKTDCDGQSVAEAQRLRIANICSASGITADTNPECGQSIGTTGTPVLACIGNPFLMYCSDIGTANDRARDARAEFITARIAYCGAQATAWQINCNGYSESATPRAAICVANGAIVTNGGADVAAGLSLFNPACANMAGVLTEQTRICLIPSSSFTTGCMDGTHGAMGEVNAARETECRKMGSTSLGDCTLIVSTRCLANPFERTTESNASLCDGSYDRLAFCRDDTKTPVGKEDNCSGQLIIDACVVDPFDTLCKGDYATDNAQQLAFCRDSTKPPEDKATHCVGELITNACVVDPFDTLCTGTFLVNDTDKLAFCRDTNRNPAGKEADCAGSLITDACVVDPFDTLCTGTFEVNNAGKLAFCRDTNRNPVGKEADCAGDLITDACVANPFDMLCVDTYLVNDTDKLTFCRDVSKPTDTKPADCRNTIETACGENPFAQTIGGAPTNLCVGTNYDTARETKCRETGTSDLGDCTATVMSLCNDNPFAQTIGSPPTNLCTGTYLTHDTRLAFCRDTGKSTANKANDCVDTIHTACTANPFEKTSFTFGDLCDGSYSREDFCRDATKQTLNKVNDCKPTARHICNNNPDPFDVLCTADPVARLDFCRQGVRAADRTKVIVPFRPDDCAPIIALTCGANPNDPLCPDNDAGRVTRSDWLRGFDKPLAKSSEPLFQPEGRNHQFLELDSDAAGAYSAPHLNLNLNTAVFDDHQIHGDVGDGVAFWRVSNSNYVGITSSTDLGAPLAERSTAGAVKWHGQIRAIGTRHGRVDADLIVDVHFYAGLNNGNVGFINAYHKANKLAGGIGGYYFNGTFNRAGVLRGTARLSGVIVANDLDFPAITGKLRGLIGAEGIVGAFLGSKLAGEGHRGGDFAGGFVAHPNVAAARTMANHAAWVASSLTGTLYSSPRNYANRGNQFLKNAAGVFPDGSSPTSPADPSSVSFAYITASYESGAAHRTRGVVRELDSGGLGTVYYRSGFTLWPDAVGGYDASRHYYAGIGTDANVGLTIHSSVTGLATWHGEFKALRNGQDNTGYSDREYATHQNLALTINFNNKSVSGTVRNGPTHGTSAGGGNVGKFDINGRWDPAGVLTGTVNHTHVTYSGNGILTGIIGDRGALGAFISEGTGEVGFSGGFFVKPAE